MTFSYVAQHLGKYLFDLAADHSAWSQATFGPGGPLGSLKHLELEAREAQESPGDITEYADCLLLLLDAARRAGFGPLALIMAARDKMKINKQRKWKVAAPGEASTHEKGEISCN